MPGRSKTGVKDTDIRACGGDQLVNQKEKILLTEEQETLLVPLYSKAVESQRPNPILEDPKALEILDCVDYDFNKLKVPRKTVVTLCIRAKKIDAYAQQFLVSHPNCIVIHLGCGLDSRYTRLNNGHVEWYDLDLPDVIDLRRKFYAETPSYHMIPSSVTDPGWMDGVTAQGRPMLVVAEGLMMYLKEEDVKALILRLKDAFPGCELVFDAFSVMTARNVGRHPSLKKTGAVVQWGIDDATTIEGWAEGIRLKEEWYFTQSEDLDKLEPGFRLSFKIAGLFTAAQKAQRLLYYSL
jgi:O-methyltransferase involved in polyketide biosynthesis